MSTDGPALRAARDLGQGWKVSPYVRVPGKSTFTLGEIKGSGAIQQIWMTPAPIGKTRSFILRFYWDGDQESPTICGTGTEDYFCGSYGFHHPETRLYQTYSTPYAGMPQVLPPDLVGRPGQRFGLYRWHIADPVRFEEDLKVTIQALGWMQGRSARYLPLEDDIASVAFWYQSEPHAKSPPLPKVEQLRIKPIQVAAPE